MKKNTEPEKSARKRYQRQDPVDLKDLPQDVWRKQHVAKALGYSPDWVSRKTNDGTLPHRRHGNGHPWYIPQEVMAWFRDQR